MSRQMACIILLASFEYPHVARHLEFTFCNGSVNKERLFFNFIFLP